jgi:hypothetical protein
MGTGSWGSANTKASEYADQVFLLRKYCDAIEWGLTEITLHEDYVIDEPKIGLLKMAPEGVIIHGVGLRVSEEKFYVMRDPV